MFKQTFVEIKDSNMLKTVKSFLITKTQDWKLALAVFFRVQFPNLNAEVMKWKPHDVKVITVDRLDKRASNALNAICNSC